MSRWRKLFATVYQHWLSVAFIAGFATDIILLNQIDSVTDNLILLFHATVATASLILLYAAVTEHFPQGVNRRCLQYAPIAMQYSFGGLFSGMLIFYGRSGDWLVSAPFLLLIIGVIAGNELVKKRSDRLLYQLALYFIGIFSYIVLVIPVILGSMGDVVFFVSGVIALVIVVLVIRMLALLAPRFLSLSMRRIVFMIGTLYVTLNAFYIFNIIPPIPLSLTELSVVQAVVRTGNGYQITYEEQAWWRSILFLPPVLHPTAGQLACFARVYAPTRLSTNITQRWEFKDVNGIWSTHYVGSYNISGQNKLGYRGYTKISNYTPGMWRCSIETARGQVLGRRTFVIAETGVAGPLSTVVE